jgi:uncharacterized protein (DUF849 family)
MNDEVIITCALTGAGDTVGVHPAIPVTPEQIADAAIEAAKAGAAVAHVHVRDPDTGAIAHDVDLFREVVERIRESDTDVVINLTAGGGGDLFLADDDPTVAAPGTDIQTPEERHAPIAECLPEICSLDCGSYNFADGIYVDPAPWVRRHAKLIQEAGVRPELECFDLGHIWLAKQLIAEGLVDDPAWFQLCVGVRWGAEATPETLLAMRNMLPEGAQWTALGVGRHQMPIAAQAVLLGGNVRVGLEDNLYLEKGVFASNGQLVEKAVSIVEHLGARVLTPEETRAKLGLRRHG